MSTDQTPALARATAAMMARDVTEPLRTFYPGATRDAVSAALQDPSVEEAIRAYLALYGLPANYSAPYLSLSTGRTHRDVAAHIAPLLADAVRAAILGLEAS